MWKNQALFQDHRKLFPKAGKSDRMLMVERFTLTMQQEQLPGFDLLIEVNHPINVKCNKMMPDEKGILEYGGTLVLTILNSHLKTLKQTRWTYHRKSYCLLAGPCNGLQMVEFSTLITTLEKPHGVILDCFIIQVEDPQCLQKLLDQQPLAETLDPYLTAGRKEYTKMAESSTLIIIQSQLSGKTLEFRSTTNHPRPCLILETLRESVITSGPS